MSLRRALSHHLPDRGFDQTSRPLPSETAFYFFNAGNLSPEPDLLQSGGNISKGRKHLAPGMQKDQVVVATFGQSALSANPEDASLQTCEPSCSLRFGKVAIPPFVILHTRLSNERLPVRQSPHHIGQVVMGLVLKRVANDEWCISGDRQPVRRGKLWVNVATRVVRNQGMIFKPEQ